MSWSAQSKVAVLFIAVQAIPGGVRGAPTPHAAKNEPLRRELVRMADEDQASSILSSLQGGPGIREKNAARLGEIIARYGWPGRSLVGEDGARAAWLIAHHDDYDVPFQKRCLELMRDALRWKEVEAWQVAYLTDRILGNEHQPQMYGTQGAGLASAEEEARVDANRKALGLEPWREYVEKLRSGHFQLWEARPKAAKK